MVFKVVRTSLVEIRAVGDRKRTFRAVSIADNAENAIFAPDNFL